MDPKQPRRVFLVFPSGPGDWIVAAEGSSDRTTFVDKDLAIGYAGLWASSNTPSQVIVRGRDGRVESFREYD